MMSSWIEKGVSLDGSSFLSRIVEYTEKSMI